MTSFGKPEEISLFIEPVMLAMASGPVSLVIFSMLVRSCVVHSWLAMSMHMSSYEVRGSGLSLKQRLILTLSTVDLLHRWEGVLYVSDGLAGGKS